MGGLPLEQKKSSIRSLVEHPFRYVKQVFGYSKTRYRGLKKNTDRIVLLLGFANLLITEKHRSA
ncbi:transposase [Marinospirillum alkaliphilum]|uniref:transposase n=1 Tax=Marinospirillum alkaliphilum TaxID=148454 RepID=UPI000A05CB1D|nr:transposase [Marinospirillum alkaliphilum]